MKKLAAILLALVLVLCSVSALAFEPVDKKDLKVGFIYIGGAEDKGFTYAHHEGTKAMMAKLGLDESQVFWRENVSEDSACADAIDELIEQGCQIIFGNSFGYQEYLKEAAEEHPEVIFSHCSGYMCNDTNFNNYWGAIYQARYLSGIVAGLKTKANLIGYVGSMNNPEVNGGLNAFALGVKSVNPDAKIYVKYTGTWYDVTLEKQTAEALLDLGCDVLGQHCDTSMPMVAAEERGAYGIGYNAVISEGEPGYKAWMTAPVWDWSAVLVSEVQSVIDGTWKPENVFFGLKEGLVSLAPLTDAAPAGAQELIDAATAKMVSGEWDVFTGPITDNQGNVVIAEGETVHYNANFGSEMTWLLDNIEAR